MNTNDSGYHQYTNHTYCVDKGQHSTNLNLVGRNLVNQGLLHLTKKLDFFGYVSDVHILFFFPAQEQTSEGEGEDGKDIDIRDMFNEPEIKEQLRELNERQWQQIAKTSDVHTHVDKVRINIHCVHLKWNLYFCIYKYQL